MDKYTLLDSLKKLESDTKLYRGTGADDFLQCLLSDISVDTEEAELFSKNYSNIESTIDMQRQSVSGVDEDEEALDLVKFQNAYNLASKMVSVMAEMYLSLIHISEPTRRVVISYAVFCLKKIFFNDTATTEIYTRLFVGSVRCV